MLQHRLALIVGGHFKDIETGFIAVGTPVVLGRLQGCIHLVEPGTNQRGVRCLGGDNTLAAPKAAGEGTVLRGDIAGIGSQCGQGFPIGQVVDVGNIPAKADAVTTGLAFRNIGGPFLRKAFGVNEVFRIQLVQPVKTFTVALLSGRADNLQVIRDGNVAILIGITIALAKAVDQDTGILVTVVDNAGHRDDIPLNAKLTLNGICVVAESDQYLLKFIHRRRHLQTQEIQPLLVDEAHISHRLDRRLFSAQLLDPRQRPDMSLGICTHGTVLRVHLKNLLEVGHIVVDVVLQIDNNALICVAQQVTVAEICRKDKIRQSAGVGHIQGDFIAPLVSLNSRPVDMYIGGFLKTFENGTVVRIGFTADRIACHTGKGYLLRQRKRNGTGNIYIGTRIFSASGTAAAGGQHHNSARQSAHFEEIAA